MDAIRISAAWRNNSVVIWNFQSKMYYIALFLNDVYKVQRVSHLSAFRLIFR